MEKLSKMLEGKSRKLTRTLSNDPISLGLHPDENGWVKFGDIIIGLDINPSGLMRIITDDSQPFEHDPMSASVRVAPGHSVEIGISTEEYTWQDGDNFVYHVINRSMLRNILANGISRMKRKMVHMFVDRLSAQSEKKQHSDDIILKIDLVRVKRVVPVYKSATGVILARHVPPSAISEIIDPKNESADASPEFKIISNKMMTPDGTIIESTNRHDYVEHYDKNGKYYAVDGGKEYLKRVGEHTDCIELSVYTNAIHEVKRENARWGARGKDGDSEMEWKRIADMSNDHILNVLLNVKGIASGYYMLFLDELKYRKLNDIFVED